MKYVCLFFLCLAWASVFIFTKIADQYVSPMFVVACRGVFAALFLFLVVIVSKKKINLNITSLQHVLLLFSSFLVGYLWFSIAYSENMLPANVASLMPAAAPVFTWLISLVLGLKRFRWTNALGIIVAITGLVVALDIGHAPDRHIVVSALVLMSGFFALSANALLVQRFFPSQDPLILTLYSVSYAAVGAVIYLLLTTTYSIPAIPVWGWLNLVAAGVFSTGVGYMLYFWLVRNVGAQFTSLFGYFVPAFGVILSALLLGDHFTPVKFYGLLTVLIGVFLVNSVPSSSQKS